MEDLYLPPRSRKTLQQINQSDSRGKKRKKQDDSEDEQETGSEEGSDDERPKKRGRPRVVPRENMKSFTDAEVNKSNLKQKFNHIVDKLKY